MNNNKHFLNKFINISYIKLKYVNNNNLSYMSHIFHVSHILKYYKYFINSVLYKKTIN
jgi:hypothetical protein